MNDLTYTNRIQIQMHPWMLVETTHVTEFEYYFAKSKILIVFEFVLHKSG